jgi:transposase
LTTDDALYRFRLRALALAQEMGNVRSACRAMGIHPSTFYRWRAQVLRFGPEILRPRERRRPRMANQTSPFIEQKVLAFALGHPGFGPKRISAELRRDTWGGIVISPNGVHRVLSRHGLNTRAKRLGLVAGYAAPPEPERPEPQPERHLEVSRPGEMVQMDCFFIGRLSGAKGAVWQYTAIDVASAHCWAELHLTPRNPSARWTSELARRVAEDLAARGWEVDNVMTDNASVPIGRVRPGRGSGRSQAPIHPGGEAPDQRGGRTGPADHLGGVLEAGLRSLPHPQVHRAPAGPGSLPQVLQHR